MTPFCFWGHRYPSKPPDMNETWNRTINGTIDGMSKPHGKAVTNLFLFLSASINADRAH